MLKFSKIMFFKEQISVKENEKYFGILKNILFFKNEIFKVH
jgi:hypothetical protein